MVLSYDPTTVVEARASTLSSLLYKGEFEVPWHQRNYDWTKEDVEEFLQDLDEAFREERSSYFLGAIVLVKKLEGKWEINDGQQRMVTFSLVCARLVRKFADGVDSRCEALALRVIFNLSENHIRELSEAEDLRPRITPPQHDKMNFDSLVRGQNIGTNGKLKTAWDEIDRHFTTMSADEAKGFLEFILTRLEVACLFVPSEIDPSAVFETLNARGKPLDDLDLIRNHLYSFFSGDSMKTKRETAHENLERFRAQLRRQEEPAEYLRCFLQCRFGYLRKDRFYRDVKSRIKTACGGLLSPDSPEYVFGLISEFSALDKVELFRSIVSPSEDADLVKSFLRYSGQANSPRNLFAFLKELRSYKITRPIVFGLLYHYVREADGREKRRVAKLAHQQLDLLSSFVMRTATITSRFVPSQFESEFSNLASTIMHANSLDNVNIVNALRARDDAGVFEDSVFVERMAQVQIRNNTKARRILLALAYFHQFDDLVMNEERYTVEHILPDSDKHLIGWKRFNERAHTEYVSRLGNLTLLSNVDNRPGTADNQSFTRKREIFESSAIRLSRAIAGCSDWSPEEIQKRQCRLAKLASQVWRLPDV